jgi:hypothetical protein
MPNNQTKPNQTQTTPLRGRGVSRSRIQIDSSSDEMPAWSERRRDVFDYVAKVLPDEHPGLAVSAALSLKLSGEKPTKEAILNRLRASGRSADQLREKGWL